MNLPDKKGYTVLVMDSNISRFLILITDQPKQGMPSGRGAAPKSVLPKAKKKAGFAQRQGRSP